MIENILNTELGLYTDEKHISTQAAYKVQQQNLHNEQKKYNNKIVNELRFF